MVDLLWSLWLRNYVEALQFHSNTQSHRSSGSTKCLPSKGSSICFQEMHKLTKWDSPVSDVSLHWWPQCDPWSLATIGPLTLATCWFSHPSSPSSILTAGHRLMRHTARIPKDLNPLLGGALWSSCILTPWYSLTGPVGQPTASCLGGQWFAS